MFAQDLLPPGSTNFRSTWAQARARNHSGGLRWMPLELEEHGASQEADEAAWRSGWSAAKRQREADEAAWRKRLRRGGDEKPMK